MKRRSTILILAASLILGLVYFGYSVRQTRPLIDRYGVKSAGDADIKRLHMRLALLNGTRWSEEQKALLAGDPESLKGREVEVANAFGSDARQIFGGVGSYDLTNLRAVFHAGSLADKKELMRADRGTTWRQWMALWATEHDATNSQLEAFYQVSQFITVAPTVSKREADAFAEKVVVPAFGRDVAKQIFGPIGDVKFAEACKAGSGPNVAEPMMANCECSYDSYWNWSCSGTCKAIVDGQCNRLSDGCGFLGYYACDSICGPSEGQ